MPSSYQEGPILVVDKEDIVSAQVILRSAAGKAPDAATAITSTNINEFAPDPEVVSRVRTAFGRSGFDVGPLIANNFAISAPAARFEQVFNVILHRTSAGGIEAEQLDGLIGLELPLDTLERSTASEIAAITFTPPPDFGTAQFMP
jgi:hypothetical protein